MSKESSKYPYNKRVLECSSCKVTPSRIGPKDHTLDPTSSWTSNENTRREHPVNFMELATSNLKAFFSAVSSGVVRFGNHHQRRTQSPQGGEVREEG